jgi:hypothetical protein
MFGAWSSHSGGYEQIHFWGHNAVWSVESQLTFRRNMSPPSSRWISQERNQHEAGRKQSSARRWLFRLLCELRERIPMFRRNMSPPSSRWVSQARSQREAGRKQSSARRHITQVSTLHGGDWLDYDVSCAWADTNVSEEYGNLIFRNHVPSKRSYLHPTYSSAKNQLRVLSPGI